MLTIKLETDAIVFSWVEKSILPNAIAIFKNVNNGPKPVKTVGIVCIILKLNFEVTRVSSLKYYSGSAVVCTFCTVDEISWYFKALSLPDFSATDSENTKVFLNSNQIAET